MVEHIAFIMDGNRRYAKKENITLKNGYHLGMKKFLEFVKYQIKYKIKTTSYFALSSENYLKRPLEEKEILFDLVKFFSNDTENEKFFISNSIQINLKGNISEIKQKEKIINFGKSFIDELEETIQNWNSQIKNPKYFVNIALNYSGQKEIIYSFNEILKQIENGNLNKNLVDEKIIKKYLWFNQKEPEIIVRPGNAPRLSGFMLWDSQYSEIYFTSKLWPEMTEEDFKTILDWYSNIQRNFGK